MGQGRYNWSGFWCYIVLIDGGDSGSVGDDNDDDGSGGCGSDNDDCGSDDDG